MQPELDAPSIRVTTKRSLKLLNQYSTREQYWKSAYESTVLKRCYINVMLHYKKIYMNLESSQGHLLVQKREKISHDNKSGARKRQKQLLYTTDALLKVNHVLKENEEYITNKIFTTKFTTTVITKPLFIFYSFSNCWRIQHREEN